MPFRYDEIGNRLKAYRLGSGLSAEEIAAQLGISRTALYRFEKGELAKIETIERLAELLGVSIPTLLGVGIEYIPSAVTYFERMRQIEETSEHIIMLSGPISFLLASDNFETTLEEVLTENVTKNVANRERALSDIPKIMEILRERKATYRRRRPTIVNLMSAMEIERFLHHGLIGRSGLPEDVLVQRKALARAEIEHFTKLLDDPPIGVQIGIVTDTLPHTGFQLFRQPDRKILVLSPFRLGSEPNVRVGVAMITSAPDALAFHEEAIDEMWGRALKGQAAADLVRHLLADQDAALRMRISPKLEASPSEARATSLASCRQRADPWAPDEASVTKTFGKSTSRIEDRDLVCGKGRFVGDIRLPGMLHAAFVRSPHAHAKIVSIDATDALALPGVVAVLTASEIGSVVTTDRLVVALPDRTYRQQRDRLILAADETVYVGEAIAMVVAADAYVAEDAAGMVNIEFELLEAVSDCRAALAENAPPVHSNGSDNLIAAFATSMAMSTPRLRAQRTFSGKHIGCIAAVPTQWNVEAVSLHMVRLMTRSHSGARRRRRWWPRASWRNYSAAKRHRYASWHRTSAAGLDRNWCFIRRKPRSRLQRSGLVDRYGGSRIARSTLSLRRRSVISTGTPKSHSIAAARYSGCAAR